RRDGEARTLGLRTRLVLRLVAEREDDLLEVPRVEARKHVRLVLVRVRRARQQAPSAILDDARVVTGGEPVRTRPPRELEQPPEAERPVAANAGIRRLAARIRMHERIDDRLTELVAKVERHVRHPERVTGLACGDDGLGRATGALRVGPFGIEPE